MEYMPMNLPADFLNRIKGLLPDEEYMDFLKSYDMEKAQALRINTLKADPSKFINNSPFPLQPVPWCPVGFYYSSKSRPGKHPYHDAGLYYIQEPSAMAAAELLDPQPGEKILDLCAAPGGKTTHIAQKMRQKGLLVTNEIHPARAKILSQNVERLGIRNALVVNETPERLAQRFVNFFDRILVDAPCSGEGMFRKDEQARAEWSLENVALCSKRQLEILSCAAHMLRPGGRLVYSTCTFSPEENEGTIACFLKHFSKFKIEKIDAFDGFSHGREDWIQDPVSGIQETLRIWPHLLRGEGHYIAVLKKDLDSPSSIIQDADNNNVIVPEYNNFCRDCIIQPPQGKLYLFGEQLYQLPESIFNLQGLKVLRAGLHLGTVKKKRFEPSHSLALVLKDNQVCRVLDLKSDSPELFAYLYGEAVPTNGEKGWTLITVDGYSIGWGKCSDGIIKNHYPKGLRWV